MDLQNMGLKFALGILSLMFGLICIISFLPVINQFGGLLTGFPPITMIMVSALVMLFIFIALTHSFFVPANTGGDGQ